MYLKKTQRFMEHAVSYGLKADFIEKHPHWNRIKNYIKQRDTLPADIILLLTIPEYTTLLRKDENLRKAALEKMDKKAELIARGLLEPAKFKLIFSEYSGGISRKAASTTPAPTQ